MVRVGKASIDVVDRDEPVSAIIYGVGEWGKNKTPR